MKKILSIISIFSLILAVSCSTDNYPSKFNHSPEKPQAGSEIQIRYKSDDEKINNSDNLEMLVFSDNKVLDDTKKSKLVK